MTTPQEPTQMTAPTREQVIQAAQAVGVPDLWMACMTDLAFEYLGKMLEAARAQALDEAAQLCDDWANSEPEMSAPQLALDLAADAIRQLKGKQ